MKIPSIPPIPPKKQALLDTLFASALVAGLLRTPFFNLSMFYWPMIIAMPPYLWLAPFVLSPLFEFIEHPIAYLIANTGFLLIAKVGLKDNFSQTASILLGIASSLVGMILAALYYNKNLFILRRYDMLSDRLWSRDSLILVIIYIIAGMVYGIFYFRRVVQTTRQVIP